MTATIRTCPRCRYNGTQTEFYTHNNAVYCKPCRKEIANEHQKLKRETALAEMLACPHFEPLKFKFIEEKIKQLEQDMVNCSGLFESVCIRSEMQYQTELYLQMAKLKTRK